MGMGADIVSENAVGWEFLAQNVQRLVRGKLLTRRPQRAVKRAALL